MRKLFTMMAALCCTLFSVMATPVSDGAIIKIGTTTVTEENKSDVLGDGKVSYDPSTHTLSLADGLNITDGLSIDVDGHTFGVKISVTGNVSIKGKNIPLHFIGFNYGYPLTIEGDENAQLDIMWNGGSDGPAVLCAKELTSSSSDAYTFKAQGGMRINLNNWQSDSYEALICHHINLNNVTLALTAYTANDALKSLNSIDDALVQTEACWYAANEVTFYNYTTLYPVKINGFQLSDGKDNLRMADMPAIKSGVISYDPAEHALNFSTGFELEADKDAGIVIDGTDLITLSGDWMEFSVKGGMGRAGLIVEAPLVIKVTGDMNFLSEDEPAIVIRNNVTIESANKYGYSLTASSVNGEGIWGEGTAAALTIDHCGVKATGKLESFSGFEFTANGVTPKDASQTWDVTEKCMMNGGSRVKNATVEFEISEWELEAVADPVAAGTITFDKGSNPYMFSAEEDVEMSVSSAATWQFDHWADIMDPMDPDYSANPRTVHLTKGSNVSYTAVMESTLPKHTITIGVAAGQTEFGAVYPSGAMTLPEGTKLTISATPNEGYLFDKWSDNGAQTHEITVGTADATYTASFKKDPNMELYPIWVSGHQLKTGYTTLTNAEVSAISSGSVIYDNASKTLYLSAADIQPSGNVPLVIGSSKEPANITIELIGGHSNMVGNYADAIQIVNSKVTITGNEKLTLYGSGTHYAISLDGGEVTLKGLVGPSVFYGGNEECIKGTKGTEKVTVIGCNLELNGATAAVSNVSFSSQYCSITPDGTVFDATDKTFKKDEVVQKNITFTSWPKITVTPVEKGTGHFKLTSENNKTGFTDEGWFEAGEEISVVAEPEKGFMFARWTDDTDWKDPDLKVAANKHDKITMPAGGVTKAGMALFYYKAQSTAKWYGVNGSDFISFALNKDQGAEVAKATAPSASSVKAGDYVSKKWTYLDGTALKAISYSSLKDGEDLPDATDLETAITENVTDMAAEVLSNTLFAVAGKKLYKWNTSDKKLDELGTFKYKGADVNVTAIAIAPNKTKYVLASGTPGQLFTVDKIKDEVAELKPVGEEAKAGILDVPVTTAAQSIAFDPEFGELFWGAPDYIRVIDTKNMRAFIAGDLGQKAGSQGVIKSLHRMASKASVEVKVASGQNEMGSVYISEPGETDKSFVTGTKATINAVANAGYHFVYWKEEDETDKITDATYEFKVKRSTVFTAYFEEGEGIESITVDLETGIQKILMNGTIYIIRDNRIYNVQGGLVK